MRDAIVVGLGGAGTATAAHLATGGASVLGLEQFDPLHAHGSSHGRTRIFRTAYFEGPAYVPLVRRAVELWEQLQTTTAEPIVRRTGGVVIGRPDRPTVIGSERTARLEGLPHELLTAAETRHRFPAFALRDDEVAVWDPNAGALFPECCLTAHARRAEAAGAELRYHEPVEEWTARPDGVEVRTARGVHRARHLVVTAGPWTGGLLRDLALPLEIERQFVLWFSAAAPDLVRPERMPVFVWDRGEEGRTYGLPDFGDGVKVGAFLGRAAATPASADRTFRESDAAPVRAFVAQALPAVVPREREHQACLFTNAPDGQFLLGPHPRHPNVTIVSACSGHGFKFASVVGEIAARLATGRPAGFDLGPFDPGRFAGSPSALRKTPTSLPKR